MNTQGPYYLNPYNSSNFGPPQLDVPIIVGRNGFMEIVNLSNYELIVSLQAMGTVFQEARSKVIYQIVQDIMGTQMLHLVTPGNNTPPSPYPPNRFVRLPVSYQNGETGFFGIWVNTYEEGEIQWYAPVPLADPPSQSSYYASKSGGSGLSLVLPNTATFFNSVDSALGTCDLLGFDLSSGGATGANASMTLTISNLNNMPDGSTTLSYAAAAATGNSITPIQVRFPTPIPNLLGAQITFSLSTSAGFTGTTFCLAAYYSLT